MSDLSDWFASLCAKARSVKKWSNKMKPTRLLGFYLGRCGWNWLGGKIPDWNPNPRYLFCSSMRGYLCFMYPAKLSSSPPRLAAEAEAAAAFPRRKIVRRRGGQFINILRPLQDPPGKFPIPFAYKKDVYTSPILPDSTRKAWICVRKKSLGSWVQTHKKLTR